MAEKKTSNGCETPALVSRPAIQSSTYRISDIHAVIDVAVGPTVEEKREDITQCVDERCFTVQVVRTNSGEGAARAGSWELKPGGAYNYHQVEAYNRENELIAVANSLKELLDKLL